MSGLGRYPLNIPSLSTSFTTSFQNLGSSSGQRRDRVDYDDRRIRDRGGDSRSRDDYRQRDNSYSRRNTQRDRFSPEPSYSYSGERRQGSQSNLVSYPLGHLDNSRSDRNNDRNDRNRYQNRDRYRNSGRSANNRGSSNQGPGILGAKPGDRSVPELPTSGLPATLGLSGNAGLTAQLAQQQQQLMAMVQTQSLLAAMQAQATAQAQRAKQGMPNPLGLLPTPLLPRGRDMQRPNRKRKMSDGWSGGGNSSYKRDRFDRNRGQQVNRPRGQNQSYRGRQSGGVVQNQQAKKTSTVAAKEAAPQESKEEEPEEEEEELEEEGEENAEGDSSQEEEKQEQEETQAEPEEETSQPDLPKSGNFVGEDVDSLMVSLFDTKRCKYICQECKIISNKAMSFHGHLMGKRHAKTVLENQGKVFDYSEFKKFSEEKPVVEKQPEPEEAAPVVEEEEKVVVPEISSPPSVHPALSDSSLDFVRYTCDTRKSALKEGSAITISSVTESRVRIEGFTSGRNMFGCEFVKAVSGFNCRLCKAFIRCGNDVICHIKGRKHLKNYQAYVQEHPQYEKRQLARNKELENVLEAKEGQELVLYEVLDEDIKKSSSKPNTPGRDSQAMEPTELQVTKFVIAPQSLEEAEHLKIECEAADTNLDLEEVENLHDTSVLEESLEEHGDVSLMEEEEKEQEADNVNETMEEEKEPADYLEQPSTLLPLALEDCIAPDFEEPANPVEEEQPKVPVAISPKWSGQKKIKEEPQDTDIITVAPEEQDTSPKVPTPTARRGRKIGTRGGTARGRGRGRGTRRSTRNAVGSARGAKVKQEKVEDEVENNDDMSFMEGFEVIDEIIDGED